MIVFTCSFVSEARQVCPSSVNVATLHLPSASTDAKPHDDIGSHECTKRILSSEMLPEKETRSTTAFSTEVIEVHSPVSDSSISSMEPNARSGWLVSERGTMLYRACNCFNFSQCLVLYFA